MIIIVIITINYITFTIIIISGSVGLVDPLVDLSIWK